METRDNAFEIVGIDDEKGTVTVEIKKGILGAMSKQLRNTPTFRKGATIVRKLGWDLTEVGNRLYGKN